jgi:hypothetical protein
MSFSVHAFICFRAAMAVGKIYKKNIPSVVFDFVQNDFDVLFELLIELHSLPDEIKKSNFHNFNLINYTYIDEIIAQKRDISNHNLDMQILEHLLLLKIGIGLIYATNAIVGDTPPHLKEDVPCRIHLLLFFDLKKYKKRSFFMTFSPYKVKNIVVKANVTQNSRITFRTISSAPWLCDRLYLWALRYQQAYSFFYAQNNQKAVKLL